MSSSKNKSSKTIQPPKGTRDLYPDDVLKRRYIQNAWRDASLRCGFDEIEGPTFESSDLYSIKSGEGILSELFQTFSGKGGQETLDKLVATGKADFALRPEFTPTLARMYTARAKQLTKPCKWFTIGPYFRAERPQRGRLREFLQWNCDIIGLDSSECKEPLDAEIFGVIVNLFRSLGLGFDDVKLHFAHRQEIANALIRNGVDETQLDDALSLLDKRSKIKPDQFVEQAALIGLDVPGFDKNIVPSDGQFFTDELKDVLGPEEYNWYKWDPSIVRGLAYYTGTVFEALVDGERALVGGGRYDNLIELMGGPSTPAVGFGMGDVTLFNALEDKHLIPEGIDLMEAVARPQASIRPQAFIAIPNDDIDDENEMAAIELTRRLRRGTESESYLNNENKKPWQSDRYAIPPLHTRTSYKSTTNPGKLRADAQKQHAKYFIEIHAPNKVALTDMDKREPITSPAGSFSTDPKAENYIGDALANLIK